LTSSGKATDLGNRTAWLLLLLNTDAFSIAGVLVYTYWIYRLLGALGYVKGIYVRMI
jgi:hypothetical protein